MKAGAVDVLTKPFANRLSLDAIRQALEQGRTALDHAFELQQLEIAALPSAAA